MQGSYSYETTFRFLGFNMTRNITFEISENGIDTAVEHVHWVSNHYLINRLHIPRLALLGSLGDISATVDAF
jgi:hypothetical protein